MSMFDGGGMGPGGMMLPGPLPAEIKEMRDQEVARSCRVAATNTVLALIQAGALGLTEGASTDDRLAEFRGLAGKYSRWLENGLVP